MLRLTALAFALFAASASAIEETRATDAAFDYDHPELWKDMDGSECAGLKNSPIALSTMDCTHYANYELHLGNCTIADMDFSITNNGVKLTYGASTCDKPHFDIPKDSITTGTKYHFNTHIHLSSEHTIDGDFSAAELHMVHVNKEFLAGAPGARAAVLGTMVMPNSPVDNPTFERYLKKWQLARAAVDCGCDGETFTVSPDVAEIDVYENMRGKDFYHYDGGLTTPPCTEVVWWNFNTEPLLISIRQFQVMTDIILNTRVLDAEGNCNRITVASEGGSTSRPPQPLNGRTIDKICALSR